MTLERRETQGSPTPVADAMEILRDGPDRPGYAEAWVMVYQTIERSRNSWLWSFPQEIRDEAASAAQTKVLRRKTPLREHSERNALAYLKSVMRNAAIDLVPRPAPPPNLRPPKAGKVRPDPFAGLRADAADLETYFRVVHPAVLELYRGSAADWCRKSGLSVEALAETVEQLGRAALGDQEEVVTGSDRGAYRKRCQRAMAVLRHFVPRIWKEKKWCPADVNWPSRSLPALRHIVYELDHASLLQHQALQTFRAMVSLSEAFHVDRRRRGAASE